MFKIPPYLKKNDKVAIVATAKKFEQKELDKAITLLKSWDLEVVLGKNLYKSYHQFAGSDAERLSDLQEMLNDESVKAIFCARGGYGTNRIIDSVNFKKFVKSPKWVIGFSDVTILLAQINKLNIESLHAVMPVQYGKTNYKKSIGTLKDALFGKSVHYINRSFKINREGQGKGVLVGGNLTILCSMIGTASDIDTNGKILFIEDIGEYMYKLDRMMLQMKRAGKLKKLKGLIVGHFSDMEDNAVPFGKTVNQIIAEAVEEYNYPVCYNFPVGHEAHNFAMICGRKVELRVENDKVHLKF